MADDSDVLITFCNQHWEEMRHIENQRATLTNLIILIASAIVGLIVQQGLSKGFLPLAALLILLGIYGVAITLKFYERSMFFQTRIYYCYKRIDEIHPNAQFLTVRGNADEVHKARFPKLVKLQVYRLWLALHIAISLLGATLVLVIIIQKG